MPGLASDFPTGYPDRAMPSRVIPDTRFMARGACLGLGDLMVPPADVIGKARKIAYQDAAEVCAQCAVRTECFEWAMLEPHPVEGGVVAGLTPNQLARERRLRGRQRRDNYVPKCGTEAAYNLHLELGEECVMCLDAHTRRVRHAGQVA